MPKKERIRETIAGLPTLDHLLERKETGWHLVALEWEREAADGPLGESQNVVEEIPYGLKVAEDCSGLVENSFEKQVIITALDMIVEDCPLSKIADELNRRGLKTRDDKPWTPSALFVLLPRMIQVGPRLFTSDEWSSRRQRLPRVV
jgi:hypothetical protein